MRRVTDRLLAAAASGWRAVSSTPALAIALALLAWPVETLAHPGSVYANSWPTALYLAAEQHLHWGRDIDYTYGPLGFLRIPLLYFTTPTLLALLYTAVTQVALSFSLLYVLRRAYGVLVATGLTFLTLCLVTDERAAAVVFIWSVVALRDDGPTIVRRAFPGAVGCVAALELLVKFNAGVVVLAIGVIAILAAGEKRARNLLWLAGTFAVSFLALWLLAHQRLGDIGLYLAGSKEIVSGYSSALGNFDGNAAWSLVVGLLTIAIVFAMARDARTAPMSRMGWGVYPLWAAAAFFFYKEGFVRSDVDHRPIFFGFALCALLALAWDRRQRGRMLLAGSVMVVALFANARQRPELVVAPGPRLDAAISQAQTMIDAGRRERMRSRISAHLRQLYALDPRTISEVRGRRMTVMPWEFAAAYAYRLRWRPLATIQPSSAYTTSLDDHVEDGLTARDGPQRILRSSMLTLDGRNTEWEMPAAMQTILCRYEQLSATARWQVLRRVPDRCGKQRRIVTVVARWGQAVAVPPPAAGAAIIVRIRGVQPRGLESLQTLVYKPAIRRVVVDVHRVYRLVAGTATDGLVLWVPPGDDYTGPFALSQRAHSLSVLRGSGSGKRSGRITYEFDRIPIHPFTRARV